MNGLMLHAGGIEVGRKELAQFKAPEPRGLWHPFPYEELVALTLDSLASSAYEVTRERYGVWKDGARLFGVIEVANKEFSSQDMTLAVGLRSSYDQSFAVSLCAGSRVFVCDNLAFSAEIRINRKNTLHVGRDMPRLIDRAVNRLGQKFQDDQSRVERYRGTPIDDRDFHDLAIRALDAGAIGQRLLGPVLDEWRRPEHEEFMPRSAWSAFNAFTAAMRQVPADELVGRNMRLYTLFDTVLPGAEGC